LILGLRPLDLLIPVPGFSVSVAGDFTSFTEEEEGAGVLISSLVNGTGTGLGNTWTAPFDFTVFEDLLDLTLHVGSASYAIDSVADGSVTTATPVIEATKKYRVSGTVTGDLAGSTLTASVTLSTATGTATIAAGPNAGTYWFVSTAGTTAVLAGARIDITTQCYFSTSALVALGMTPADIADQLVANAASFSTDVFLRPDQSNAFAVWSQTTYDMTVSGPSAEALVLTTSTGIYMQDDFGRAIPPYYAPDRIQASVQPLRGRERLQLQELFAGEVSYKCYTESEVPVADHRTEHPGARALYKGQTFRVLSVDPWDDLIKHRKFFLQEELEAE